MMQTQPSRGMEDSFEATIDEQRSASSSSFAAESFFVQFQQNRCVSAACSPLSLPTPVSALSASDEHVLSVVVGAMGPVVLEPPPQLSNNINNSKKISARRPVSDLYASALSHSYAAKVGSCDTSSSQSSSLAGSFPITPSTNHFISNLVGNVMTSDSGCAVNGSFQSTSLSPSQSNSNNDCRSSPPLLLSPQDESHNESETDEDENLDHWHQNPFMNHSVDFAVSTTVDCLDSDVSDVEVDDDEDHNVRICVGSLASNSSTRQMMTMQHPHSMAFNTTITSISLILTDSDSNVLSSVKKFRSGSVSIPCPSPSTGNNTPGQDLHPEFEIVRNEDTSLIAPICVEQNALAKSWAAGGNRKPFMGAGKLHFHHRKDHEQEAVSTSGRGCLSSASYQKWKQHQHWSNSNPAMLLKYNKVSGSPTRPESWYSSTAHTIYPDAYELFSNTFYGSSCPIRTQPMKSLLGGSHAPHLFAHKPRLAELVRIRRFLLSAPEAAYKPLEPAVFDDLVARGDVMVRDGRVVAVRGVEEVRREEELRDSALVEQHTPAVVVRKSSLSEAAQRTATTLEVAEEPVVRRKKSYKRMLVMSVDREELVFDEDAQGSAASTAPRPPVGLHVKGDAGRHVSFASVVQVADGSVVRLDDSPKAARAKEFRRRAMVRAVKGLEKVQPHGAVTMDFCATSRPTQAVAMEEMDESIIGTCSWFARLFGVCFGMSRSVSQQPSERPVNASTPLFESPAPTYGALSRPQVGGFEGLFLREDGEGVHNNVRWAKQKELKWSDDESSDCDDEQF
ncbi:hypothetical protein BC830DRAFT_1099529 [Chytriomyces sp. MP71]|nr:hypothetical protein BC830DRAFT_1099529 [Chytriomyces sp. MP71]